MHLTIVSNDTETPDAAHVLAYIAAAKDIHTEVARKLGTLAKYIAEAMGDDLGSTEANAYAALVAVNASMSDLVDDLDAAYHEAHLLAGRTRATKAGA